MSKNFYTSREQSKRLIGLLPEDSADLVYISKEKLPLVRADSSPLFRSEIPCWSTGALLYILSDLVEGDYKYESDNDCDLIDSLVNIIERIYKNDKKEG